jgi:glutamate/tyrosine decarboxylase-like PLP-dependent enzyme
MQRLGHQVADIVAEHLATLRSQPVIGSLPRHELNKALLMAAPARPTSFDSIIGTLHEHVFPYHAREPHPGFMAYIPSSPTFPALMGDWLATGFNFFAGVWSVAAGPNEIEMVVLEWFRDWLGLPDGASGLLTTGGSAANLTAMVAARHAFVERGRDITKLVVYTSAQAHSSVIRSAWIAGLDRSNVRMVAMDDRFRIDVNSLREAIDRDRSEGLEPCAVVASAGTTNTGSVDPVGDIATVCEKESLWLHVDAAYAGFAVLTEEGRRLIGALDRADSITLDPHKWLFVPFECGCLMFRDPSRLHAAFHIMPEYLKDVAAGEEEINFADRGEQLTRYSRALKIWVSVNYFGTDAIAAAIQDAMDRARIMESLVKSDSRFELLCPAQFGICCFRARLDGLDESRLDALNEQINSIVVAEGRFLISSTRINGRFSLRMCTLGFRTTHDDVRELFESISRALGQLQ